MNSLELTKPSCEAHINFLIIPVKTIGKPLETQRMPHLENIWKPFGILGDLNEALEDELPN